jgi:hypothetical protein
MRWDGVTMHDGLFDFRTAFWISVYCIITALVTDNRLGAFSPVYIQTPLIGIRSCALSCLVVRCS